MQVKIYIGNKEITNNEIKNYICISKIVQDTVNDVYYKYLKEREKTYAESNAQVSVG